MPDATEPSRRGLTIFAALIVVAFGALAVSTALSGRIDLREGSEPEEGPPVEITRTLESYSIVYRVETGRDETRNMSTEKLDVARPFESRFRGFNDPPPGTRQVSTRGSTAGRLETDSTALVIPLSLASGDVRFDAALGAAVAEGVVERRERRSVFGRPRQVYRTKEPVSSGNLVPLADDDDGEPNEYTDACIDEAGLLVEEFWVQSGVPLRRKVAVEVIEDPDLARDLFPEFREGAGPQGGVIGIVEPHAKSWEIVAPDGFERTGTFVVAAPDLSGPNAAAPIAIAPPQMQTDVYQRGPDLILVEQDPSLSVIAGRTGDRYVVRPNIEGFGEAEVVWDFRMTEVRVVTADSYVRISGTLPPDELIAVAATMRQGSARD